MSDNPDTPPVAPDVPVQDVTLPDGVDTGTSAPTTPTTQDLTVNDPAQNAAADVQTQTDLGTGDLSADLDNREQKAADEIATGRALDSGDLTLADVKDGQTAEDVKDDDADLSAFVGDTVEIEGMPGEYTIVSVEGDHLTVSPVTPPTDPAQTTPDTRLADTSDQDNLTEPAPAYPTPALGDQVMYRNPDNPTDDRLHPAFVTAVDDERNTVSLFVLYETQSNFIGAVSSGDEPGAWRPA